MNSKLQSPSSLCVRPAAPGDAHELAELRWLSRTDSERARQSQPEFTAQFAEWFSRTLQSEAWCIAVAEQGHALAGCMYLHLVGKVPVPGDAQRGWGYITHAYVREGGRGAGTGAALLKLLTDRARSLRLEFLVVWPSSEALAFYQRAGFLSPAAQLASNPDDEPAYLLQLQGA